jgi:regulatory protein
VAKPLSPERAASGVAAREAALRMLARGPRTEHEITERLLLRGFERGAVEEAVQRLRRVSLLDDRAFLLSFLRRELLRRAESGGALRSRLRRRGIPPDLLADLDATIAGDPDLAAESLATEEGRARRARSELRRRLRSLGPEERRRRVTQALARRGFSWDVIRDLLNEEASESSDETPDG